MRSSVVGRIQERADAFVTKCAESAKESLDVYVKFQDHYEFHFTHNVRFISTATHLTVHLTTYSTPMELTPSSETKT